MTKPANGSRDRRLKVAFASLGVALGLVMLEVGCRLILPPPPNPERQPQILYRKDPDVGSIHVPGQRGWIDDGLMTINRLGFRGAVPATPKPPGLFRILALGDSTTVGWGVHDGETYPAQLEAILAEADPAVRFEVVNLAVSGHDGHNAVRVLRKFAPVMEPDFVVVGLSWNDFGEAALEPEEREAKRRLGRKRTRDPRGYRLVGAQPPLRLLLRRSRALYAANRLRVRLQYAFGVGNEQLKRELALLEDRRSEGIERAWVRVEEALRELKSVADAGATPMAIVAMPFRSQLRGAASEAMYQQRIAAMCRRLGIEMIDPLPLFWGQRHRENELFIPYDRSHPAAGGYRLIAESVAAVVTRSLTDVRRGRTLGGASSLVDDVLEGRDTGLVGED